MNSRNVTDIENSSSTVHAMDSIVDESWALALLAELDEEIEEPKDNQISQTDHDQQIVLSKDHELSLGNEGKFDWAMESSESAGHALPNASSCSAIEKQLEAYRLEQQLKAQQDASSKEGRGGWLSRVAGRLLGSR